MAKRVAKGSAEKRLQKVLDKVESTSRLIRAGTEQMGKLATVLDHWGDLIKVTQIMGQKVIDSEKWVDEIKLAVQAMTKRSLFAAKKLQSIIAAHQKNKKRNGT